MITQNYKELDDTIRMKIPQYLYNGGQASLYRILFTFYEYAIIICRANGSTVSILRVSATVTDLQVNNFLRYRLLVMQPLTSSLKTLSCWIL